MSSPADRLIRSCGELGVSNRATGGGSDPAAFPGLRDLPNGHFSFETFTLRTGGAISGAIDRCCDLRTPLPTTDRDELVWNQARRGRAFFGQHNTFAALDFRDIRRCGLSFGA